MKIFMILGLLSSLVHAAPATTKKPMPASKSEEAVRKDQKNKEPNALDKKEADCDEKAKKPVEITPEAISLSGSTGCSLDDAHP